MSDPGVTLIEIVRADGRPACSTGSTGCRRRTTWRSSTCWACGCSRRPRHGPTSRSGCPRRSRRRCCCRAGTEVADRADRDQGGGRVRHDRRPARSCRASWRGWSPRRALASRPTGRTTCADGRDVPVLPGNARARRRHAVRPVRRRAALRGRGTARQPGRGRRRRPDASRRWPGRRGTAGAGPSAPTDEDTTGGLNRPGEVVLHIPAGAHAVRDRRASGRAGCAAGSPNAVPDQPFYSESPTVRDAEAFTVGGTMTVEHAETVTDVPLGSLGGRAGADGSPRPARRCCSTPSRSPCRCPSADGWQDWTVVDHFGALRARRPARRPRRGRRRARCSRPRSAQADGTLRAFGAVPRKGAAHPGAALPHRRRAGGQRRARRDLGAAQLGAVRGERGEPRGGRRRASTARPSRRRSSAPHNSCACRNGR